ncbi:unnamed protein product [Rotaria magnacalcarata]|uniref:Uncharacterized protein n=2 Tax=Rotaria magnacalcarata TaxID=392030 RepID=A0A816HA55_9BILA|nr:unnamed protein product [Rotaria magnacalcarata]CAF2182723.1 unnamed protein product [Rotaria magnacalcarata]
MMNQLLLPINQDYHNVNLEKLIAKCQLHSKVILEKQGLTDRDMSIVADQAIIQRQCTELWLKHNTITSQGALILADALQHNNVALSELYLYGNQISDVGSGLLAKAMSTEHSTLKRLSLGFNGITDEGARYFADMLKINRTLIHLLLSTNQISDRGCLHLANAILYHNTTLERLDLDSNHAVTDSSVKTLVATIQVNDNLIGLNLADCTLSASSKAKLHQVAKAKQYFQLWV